MVIGTILRTFTGFDWDKLFLHIVPLPQLDSSWHFIPYLTSPFLFPYSCTFSKDWNNFLLELFISWLNILRIFNHSSHHICTKKGWHDFDKLLNLCLGFLICKIRIMIPYKFVRIELFQTTMSGMQHIFSKMC